MEKLKSPRKRKLKKRYWLPLIPALLLAFMFFMALMLMYKPDGLKRPPSVREKEISRYLTNELLPGIYNQVQLGERFEVAIPQEKTEELVKLSQWPRETEGLKFLMPSVSFEAESIVIRGIVVFRETEFAVKVVGRPEVVEGGLLNLRLAEVEVGAVDITMIAKALAKNYYDNRLKKKRIDKNDPGEKVIASLLADVPFDPVFKIEGSRVRIDKVAVTNGLVTIGLSPTGK